MLDVLSEIYRQRGQAAPDRRGADRSVHTVGYLIEAPDPVTYLCTVSVFDSEPIAGVPATSMDYTGITAVHVLLDPFTGRPVHVLGPAGELAFGEVPFERDTRHVVTGHIVPPTSTGTYREDEAAWDRYSTMTFGGVTDVWQQAAPVATNLVPNPEPTAPDEGGGWGYISATDWADDSGASDGFKIINLTFGPTGYSDSSYESVHRSDTSPCEYWPVDTGTGAIVVAAATSYDLSVHVGGNEFTTTLSATVKCRWYDSGGSLLSTSAGSAVNCTTSGPAWDNSGTPATGYVSANPSETFTAPTSAAYAQPFVELSWPSATSRGVWVAAWVMQVN